MRNYKLIIVYDGTNYQGWQRQKTTSKTIQGMIEQAITQVVGYEVTIDGAGRTDRGVHAKGQVANVKLSRKVDCIELRDTLNQKLPDDIRVKQIEMVKKSFHSRYCAKAKIYEYCIEIREKPDVFTRKYRYHHPQTLDVSQMEKAASLLIGTHDFKSFTDQKDERGTVRSIYDIKIVKVQDQIKIVYYGTGFLYHMVRIITGTLIEVGRGERDAIDIPAILQAKKRVQAGYLVPAQGLNLVEVKYECKPK